MDRRTTIKWVLAASAAWRYSEKLRASRPGADARGYGTIRSSDGLPPRRAVALT